MFGKCSAEHAKKLGPEKQNLKKQNEAQMDQGKTARGGAAATISSVRRNLPSKPWISKELLEKINTKNKLYRKLVKTKCKETDAIYRDFRNKLCTEIREAKAEWLKAHGLVDEGELR